MPWTRTTQAGTTVTISSPFFLIVLPERWLQASESRIGHPANDHRSVLWSKIETPFDLDQCVARRG
jgi:hypothetical protein